MLTLILIQIIFSIAISEKVTERGGLIYEYEGNAQINPDFVQFVRLVDTTSLFALAKRLRDGTTLYNTYCQTLEDSNLPKNDSVTILLPKIKYFHTPLKYPIKEAPGVCKRFKARLPEIRDKSTQNDIRSYANLHNISRIAAGIEYDVKFQLFVFQSDKSNARTNSPFTSIQYGGTYTHKDYEAAYESDEWLTGEAKHYPLIYRYPGSHFTLRLADSYDLGYSEHIMCEIMPELRAATSNEHNWLTQLAVHNCKREQSALIANSQFSLSEINSITTLNFTLTTDEPDWNTFFPKFDIMPKAEYRKKRQISDDSEEFVDPDPYWVRFKTHDIRLPENPYRTKPVEITIPASNSIYSNRQDPIEIGRYIIQPKTPFNTIPDLINILYSFWYVQTDQGFTYLTFPMWMKQQARRQPLYSFLRMAPSIIRVERDTDELLQMIHDRVFFNDVKPENVNETLLNTYLKEVDFLVDQFSALIHNETNLEAQTLDYHYSQFYDFAEKIPKQTSSDPHSIHKRFVPVIIAAAAGAVIGAGITSIVATSSSLERAQSNSPDIATLELFRQNAKIMSNVQINQNQIVHAIEDINSKLDRFENQVIGNFQGTATVILEEDLRAFLRHLQNVVQITLLKYNAAMLAAADTRTSPYVLPQKDLEDIADGLLRTKSIQITRDVNSVRTYTLVEDNKITFIFDIPIIDPKKEFLLYTIKYLPSFKDNVTLTPKLDSNHVAINSQGDKYTVLSDIELNKCLDLPPRCNSHIPIIPIRDESSCVALTYITNQPQCPYEAQTDVPRPHFLFFDITLFYSVPKPTTISGQCFKSTLSNGYKTGVLPINGTGKVTVTPTCVITLPDGSTHTTPSRPLNQSELSNPVFSELSYLPHRTDFLIHDNDEKIFKPIHLEMQPIEPPTFHEVFKNSFHAANSLSTLTIIIICFAVFGCVFISVYCFCPNAFMRCFCTEKIRSFLLKRPNRGTYTPGESYDDSPLGDAIRQDCYLPSPSDRPQSIQIRPKAPPIPLRKINEDEIRQMDTNPLKNTPMSILKTTSFSQPN